MNINIGGTISKMRKEKSLTQEQISEIFGVSVAAVSKWETGAAYPDIALLPVIAGFFDVSVDRLLGYDMSRSTMSIGEHLKKADNLFYGEKKEKEAIAYLGSLAYRYPNNIKVLFKYANAKVNSAARNPSEQAKKKLFKEAGDILRSVNINGLSRKEQDSLTKAYFGLYIWSKEFDKVEAILNELKPDDDGWDIDGAEFWFYMHKHDVEKATVKYYSILEKMLTHESIIYGQYHINYHDPDKAILTNGKLIQILNMFSGDFSAIPYKMLSNLHEGNALMYARLGRDEDARREVEKVIELYAKSDGTYEPFAILIKREEPDEAAFCIIKEMYENLTMKPD